MSNVLRRRPITPTAGASGLCMVVALSIILVGFRAGSGVQAEADRRMSRAERAALAAGELVVRPRQEQRGAHALMGGSSWQVIDAPPAVVFQALLDTERYHRMLPQVSEARLVPGHSRRRRTVFFRHAAGPVEVSYFANLRVWPARRELRFSLDRTRPHGLRAAFGFYTVRAFRGGRSLLAYGVMADLGPGLLRALVRDSVHEWMLKTPMTIKHFVESGGRRLYSGGETASETSDARLSRAPKRASRPTPDSEL